MVFREFCLALLLVAVECHNLEWSYHGANGPSEWGKVTGWSCNGRHQSPINFIPSKTVVEHFRPFELKGYDPADRGSGTPVKIFNNGHTAEVVLDGKYIMHGGGLPDYRASQLHFHWGSVNRGGSEHTVNGKHYPAEMHIVSSRKGEGLAVLAVFLEVGPADNPDFAQIVEGLQHIKYKGDEFHFTDKFSVRCLLPDDLSKFYRYHGSLTTPPCSEIVRWTVFENPVSISQRQLEAFGALFTNTRAEGSHEHIIYNYRPIQARNGRQIKHSD